jgi:hypothetical protein
MGEKGKIRIGFRLFLLANEIIIVGAILGVAWLINKTLIAPPLIVSFRLIRMKIETKYDVLHLPTVFTCMIFSTLICSFGVYLSLPDTVSFVSNIIVGVCFAIISWHLQEIIDLKTKYNRKQILIDRCEEIGYNEFKTQLAVMFFIENKKPKEVWEWICINRPMAMSWDAVRNLKCKMKKDLF